MSETVTEVAAPAPRSQKSAEGVGRGLSLLAGSRITVQFIQFASSIWLARLLTPSDYGVFAIIMTISTFAGLLNDFGLTEALVKQIGLLRWHADGAFWVNAFSGLLLFVVSALISPLLARVFDEARLVYLFPLAALTFIISTNVVQIAILQRHRRFGLLAAADVANSLVLMIVTTILALLGAGVVSLVAGLLAGTSVMTAMLWREVHWRPARPRRAPMMTMLRSSSGNLGFSSLTLVGNTIDTYAVGIASSTATLGAYNRAYNLSRMPSSFVGGVLNRVLLPVFADLRDDPPQLARTWAVFSRRTMLVLAPGAAFMSVFASPLIAFLYGSRWAASGSYLAVLAWVIPAFAFASCVGPFLFLMARQRTVFAVGAAQAVIFVAAIAIGLLSGIDGIVWAVLAASYLGHVPLVWVCLRAARIPAREVFAALRTPLATTAAVVLVSVVVDLLLSGIVSVLVGGAAMLACVVLAFALSESVASLVAAAGRVVDGLRSRA